MRDQIMNVPSESEELTEQLTEAKDKYEAAVIMADDAHPSRAAVARPLALARRVSFASSVDLELCRCVRRQRGCHRATATAMPCCNAHV